MAGYADEAEFTARYGFPPQEYFNRVVKSDAKPPRLAEWEAGLAKAEAAVKATKGWESLQANDPKFVAGAQAENDVTYFKQLVDSAKWRAPFAQAFLAGTLADYGPYLGTEGQWLKKMGWIDTLICQETVESFALGVGIGHLREASTRPCRSP